ncbi:MAG TPA: hypothetical protein VK773_08680 [Acidimicrobiales bacterium]|jgi:hypothetical protein|nr:hypothetical protein [Acidimicrobiales bacterium]
MVLGVVAALAALALAGWAVADGSTNNTTVLLVGTYHGKVGQYTSIQAAVDVARPGDWILVAPGDYHESDDAHVTSAEQLSTGDHGGLVVTTPDLHIRGMNRNSVIVDGTKEGTSVPCSSAMQDQNFGPMVGGKAQGRNGIVVWKADNVSIENLTVCNFLGGAGDSGNEVWWNGGDGSGKIGLKGYTGSYLTGTSNFFSTESTAAQYGIFSSNSQGRGSWNQIYGSNMNDSGMYVGACLQVCDVTIDHAWMENSALGYSGTNSGGSVVIENSQFDNNEDGVDTNTQIAGDPPPPQNGACPHGGTSPITHTHSCWVFIHNDVHDNNNPDVPQAGNAAAGPIGTGMTLSGGRNDTVMDNTFANNGAWGTLFIPYPDSGTPSLHQVCSNYGGFQISGLGCVFEDENDKLAGNTYTHDGYFGNPTNADFGQIVLHSGLPSNCYAANNGPQGSAPPYLEILQPTCGKPSTATNLDGALVTQVECDSGLASCPAGTQYPPKTGVHLAPLPSGLPTMADPCAGVPSNAWCTARSSMGSTARHGGHGATASGAQAAAGAAYRGFIS